MLLREDLLQASHLVQGGERGELGREGEKTGARAEGEAWRETVVRGQPFGRRAVEESGRVVCVRAFVGCDHHAGVLARALHSLSHWALRRSAPVVVSAAGSDHN